jgi:type I restriction enzyme S subunit
MPGASSPEGYKQTKVGMIPEEWRIESIHNLSQKTNGINPINNPNRIFKYIDVSCISRDTLKITNYLEYNGENAPSRAKKLIKEGDILFSTIRPYLKQLAKVPAALDGEVCSTAFCIIRCDTKKVDPEYVFQSVTTDKFVSNVSSLQTGSNYPAVTDKDILSQPIPLPPLPEQRQIAAILSTVDAAIAATAEVIAKTEDLKRGLMQDLLTKGIDEAGRVRSEETHAFCEKQGMRVPVEWRVGKFSRVCKKALNGGTPSTKIPEYWEGTIPWITGADVVDQRIGEVRKYITAEAVENSATHVIPKGMLLLVTRTGVGKVAIAPFDIAISQDLTGIITTDDASVEYLFWTFNRANGHFLNMNQGTSINGIKRKDLMNFALPLPPLPEQHRIATILSTVDRDLAAERDHRARLQTLKKGLMQDLLTGRKRVPLDGGEAHGA